MHGFYLNVSHVHLITLLSEICGEASIKTVNQKGWYQFWIFLGAPRALNGYQHNRVYLELKGKDSFLPTAACLNMRASWSKPLCEMNMTSAAWGLCSVLINQRYVFHTVSFPRAHTTEGLRWSVNEKVVTRGSKGTKAGFLPGAVVECSLIRCWQDFTEHTTANDRNWP